MRDEIAGDLNLVIKEYRSRFI